MGDSKSRPWLMEVTLNRPGPTWVDEAIVTYERSDVRRGDWISRQLAEPDGVERFRLCPVTVNVDGLGYEVLGRGRRGRGGDQAPLPPSITPDSEAPESVRAKALYTAGVLTQRLDGLFDRPAVAGLPTTGEGQASSVADPSSRNLLKLYGRQYSGSLRDSGMRTSLRGRRVCKSGCGGGLLRGAETASTDARSQSPRHGLPLQARVGLTRISFNVRLRSVLAAFLRREGPCADGCRGNNH